MSRNRAPASMQAVGVVLLVVLAAGAYGFKFRRAPSVPTIALIPQTTGAMLWELEHFGATVAAEKLKCHLYWNTPTSENDVAGQVSLIDRVVRGDYQGLIVAPNHPLAILAPLRRALAAGLPVVVIGASLDLPSGDRLGYIVNDDQQMGGLAAEEMARLIHGKGSIALVGLGRYAPGVTIRVRAAEMVLAGRFPDIHIVKRMGGAFNTARAEELTNSTLKTHPELNGVLSFTASSTRGVHAAVKGSLRKNIRLVGCEQDSDLMGYVDNGEIAALLAENTYRMGFEAVGRISASLAGKPLPARLLVAPTLVTQQNLHSAEVSLLTSIPK